MEEKRKVPVPPKNLQNSQNNVARNFPPPPPTLKKEQNEEVKEEKVEPQDRKSTRLNSSHESESRMPSSA